MPRVGMKPIRRAALVKATIAEVGRKGSLDVTVARIAARAGVSSGLAHHYFGGKEDLLFAAMRHILSASTGPSVRAQLARARTPRARLDAIIRASFGPDNFEPEVIAAWLSFYVHAQSDPGARRLLAHLPGPARLEPHPCAAPARWRRRRPTSPKPSPPRSTGSTSATRWAASPTARRPRARVLGLAEILVDAA